jgi:hypothetical protein
VFHTLPGLFVFAPIPAVPKDDSLFNVAASIAGDIPAVLAASIFHYGKYTINQAKIFLRDKGVPVRIEKTIKKVI